MNAGIPTLEKLLATLLLSAILATPQDPAQLILDPKRIAGALSAMVDGRAAGASVLVWKDGRRRTSARPDLPIAKRIAA